MRLKPLYVLKIRILEKYGRQFIAARELGVREDELSAILSGRKRPSSDFIEQCERLLGVKRKGLKL